MRLATEARLKLKSELESGHECVSARIFGIAIVRRSSITSAQRRSAVLCRWRKPRAFPNSRRRGAPEAAAPTPVKYDQVRRWAFPTGQRTGGDSGGAGGAAGDQQRGGQPAVGRAASRGATAGDQADVSGLISRIRIDSVDRAENLVVAVHEPRFFDVSQPHLVAGRRGRFKGAVDA